MNICERAIEQQKFLYQFSPPPEEAVDAYQQTGGQLTLFPKFGSDPLDGHSDLQDARHQGFITKYPDFEPLFSAVVNGNELPFRLGLLEFISLTTRLVFNLVLSSCFYAV